MKMLARWKEGLFWRSESVRPWWIIPVAETDWPTRTGKPSVPTGALLLRVRTRYRIGKQYQKDLALASWQKGGSSKPAWVVELSETEHGKYFREGIGSVAVYQRPPIWSYRPHGFRCVWCTRGHPVCFDTTKTHLI